MPDLNQRQFLLLTVLLSVATAFFSTLIALGIFTGERPSQIAERVIEREPIAGDGAETRVVRQDELVVSVVKRVSPAVVSVVATKDVPVVERFFVDPFEGNPFFEGFLVPQFRQRGTEKREVGAGTGFIVSPEGLILTNKHVVSDEDADYTVFLADGTKLASKILARDPVQDLAVLKVDPADGERLPSVALGDSSAIEIGQTMIAIGNALGEFRNTVSVGVISGLGRTVIASGSGVGAEELAELIQTDAAINPGNSGGPLLNLKGEVIGINVAMAQGAENIGFAIPINKAKRDIASVKAVGRIVYPFLGIRYVIVTKAIQEERNLSVDYGALIVGGEDAPAVVAGSPADRAGLKEGDVILELDSERIEVGRTLSSLIQKYNVGDTVTLKVGRGSQALVVVVKLEERR